MRLFARLGIDVSDEFEAYRCGDGASPPLGAGLFVAVPFTLLLSLDGVRFEALESPWIGGRDLRLSFALKQNVSDQSHEQHKIIK